MSSVPSQPRSLERMTRPQLEVYVRELIQKCREIDQERVRLLKENENRLEFLHVLAHELRTAVTPILAAATLLQEIIDADTGSTERKALGHILSGVERLGSRIDDLLDVAAFQAGALRLDMARFDAAVAITETCDCLQPEARTKKQQIVLEIPENLGVLRADRGRFQQLLSNLLTNAIKFSPEGGVVTVRAVVEGGSLTVTVRDCGRGIPAAVRARLFEPYFRTEEDRQWLPGLGLGLALCRQIVEAHGGRIWVESEPGKGSTFGFSLPLGEPP